MSDLARMTVDVRMVLEEKEEGGRLPSAPQEFTAPVQDLLADHTKHDMETPWRVLKVHPAGPPSYISAEALESGREVLVGMLLTPEEHRQLAEMLEWGAGYAPKTTGAHAHLHERLVASGVLQT